MFKIALRDDFHVHHNNLCSLRRDIDILDSRAKRNKKNISIGILNNESSLPDDFSTDNIEVIPGFGIHCMDGNSGWVELNILNPGESASKFLNKMIYPDKEKLNLDIIRKIKENIGVSISPKTMELRLGKNIVMFETQDFSEEIMFESENDWAFRDVFQRVREIEEKIEKPRYTKDFILNTLAGEEIFASQIAIRDIEDKRILGFFKNKNTPKESLPLIEKGRKEIRFGSGMHFSDREALYR